MRKPKPKLTPEQLARKFEAACIAQRSMDRPPPTDLWRKPGQQDNGPSPKERSSK